MNASQLKRASVISLFANAFPPQNTLNSWQRRRSAEILIGLRFHVCMFVSLLRSFPVFVFSLVTSVRRFVQCDDICSKVLNFVRGCVLGLIKRLSFVLVGLF